jgi:hypothetical protein
MVKTEARITGYNRCQVHHEYNYRVQKYYKQVKNYSLNQLLYTLTFYSYISILHHMTIFISHHFHHMILTQYYYIIVYIATHRDTQKLGSLPSKRIPDSLTKIITLIEILILLHTLCYLRFGLSS